MGRSTIGRVPDWVRVPSQVWGRDWVQAKTQAECYDYLFAAAVAMRRLGVDPETSTLSGAQDP